jgi:putative oxidoreductase
MTDLAVAVGRILMAAIFIVFGYIKLTAGYGPTQGYMNAMGLSGTLLPAVIAFEFCTAIAISLGALTRWFAAATAVFCVMTAVYFHADTADPIQLQMLFKNVSMAGGFVLLAAVGAGRFSVDEWYRRRMASRPSPATPGRTSSVRTSFR